MKVIASQREIPRESGTEELGERRKPLSVRELRVLTVLNSRPFGFPSIAEVARAADLPPTTTGRILRRLLDIDLVSIDKRPAASGGGQGSSNWMLNSPPPTMAGWPATEAGGYSKTQEHRVPSSHAVPHQFWRHFQNSNPRELTLPRDAHHVADRLIRGQDPAALCWVLENLPVGLLARFVDSPEFDPRARSIIRDSLHTRIRKGHTN